MSVEIKQIDTINEKGKTVLQGYRIVRITKKDGEQPLTADILPTKEEAKEYAAKRGIKLSK